VPVVRRTKFHVVLWLTLAGCGARVEQAHGLETTAARVERTVRRSTTKLVRIGTSHGVVLTTPDHLFAKQEGGWIAAGALSAGDRIASRDAPDGARVLSLEVQAVPPTPVYNLTVAKTHAYLVGSEGLLVHNVNCNDRSTLGKLLEQERQRELKEQETRADLADLRQRRKGWLDDRRRTFNDALSNQNCVYCTLGGLSDFDKVSAFTRRYNLDLEAEPNIVQTFDQMQELGLVDDSTPSGAQFGSRKGRFPWSKPVDAKIEAETFMKESTANVFVLSVRPKSTRGIDKGHAMLAVRREDGSITYVDLQQVPPAIYDALNPKIDTVIVVPTNVDWRFNRKLFDVVRGSPPTPARAGWPDTGVIPLPKKLPQSSRRG
jgi:hypothetical protein